MLASRQTGQRIGRPDAESSQRLDRLILDTAERLFAEQGYAATSMEQIATAAGSGKQTIYRRYSSKEDLFRAVTAAMTSKLVALMTRSEATREAPLAALRQACRELLDFACKPEVIAIYRVLIAEAERFPALVSDAMRDSMDAHDAAFLNLLQAARDAGAIRSSGTTEALMQALSGLITGSAVSHALLGRNSASDDAGRAAFFETAWAIFLRGAAATEA